jgi:hypothetical protein
MMRRSVGWMALSFVVLLACNRHRPRGVVADAEEFCRERDAWECARMNARGELPSLMYADVQACVDDVANQCAGFNWPPECSPSPKATDACIEELTKPENLNTPTEMIPACTVGVLCGSTSALIAPDAGRRRWRHLGASVPARRGFGPESLS